MLSENSICLEEISEIEISDFPFIQKFENNQYRHIELYTKNDLEKVDHHPTWLFVIKDVVIFKCNIETQKIYYIPQKNFTDDLFNYWLTHILLPIYFNMSNIYYFLHAGTVEFDGSAVLFMGHSHAGKSTLTNHLLQKKHPLICDDKLATYEKDGKFFAVPSHPYHRPYRGIEDLGLKANNFITYELPIGSIYDINPIQKEQPIKIEKLNGIEKFKCLRYSTEIDLPIYMKERFEYITKMSNTIPIYKIYIPRDLDKLDEVYEEIKIHQKNLRRENDT